MEAIEFLRGEYDVRPSQMLEEVVTIINIKNVVTLLTKFSAQNENSDGVVNLSEEMIVKIFLDNEFRCIEEDQTVSVVPSIQRNQYRKLANKIRQAFIDARQSA
ncbi:MAG: hypothetical protein M0R17_01615 [Candidatus Omnitrophica bacterium]|jgi:hypothetical protein|nr:hypothetical protein [Candidatus Omnitrophota bacterium]